MNTNQDLIELLREARPFVDYCSCCGMFPARAALARIDAALAQAEAEPKQEPVAYRHLHDEDGWEYYDAPTGADCMGCQPLYSAPQPAAPAVPDEAELKFLDEWLTFATEPVGLQCCGRSRGGECCMDPEPTYPSRNEVIDAMAARHRELTAMLAAAQEVK